MQLIKCIQKATQHPQHAWHSANKVLKHMIFTTPSQLNVGQTMEFVFHFIDITLAFAYIRSNENVCTVLFSVIEYSSFIHVNKKKEKYDVSQFNKFGYERKWNYRWNCVFNILYIFSFIRIHWKHFWNWKYSSELSWRVHVFWLISLHARSFVFFSRSRAEMSIKCDAKWSSPNFMHTTI